MKFGLTPAQWEAAVRASGRYHDVADIPQIAAICAEKDCPVWHGASIFYDRLAECVCALCLDKRLKVK